MRIINGIRYYTKKEVAELVGVTAQTIQLYHKWSEEREQAGLSRFIPAPMRLENGYKMWTERDVATIKQFRAGMERGDLAEYSKQQWSYKTKAEEQVQGV